MRVYVHETECTSNLTMRFPCRSNLISNFASIESCAQQGCFSMFFFICRSGGVCSGRSGDTRWITKSDDRLWGTLRCEKRSFISHASRGVSPVR